MGSPSAACLLCQMINIMCLSPVLAEESGTQWLQLGLSVISYGAFFIESMEDEDGSSINHTAHDGTLLLKCVFRDGRLGSHPMN